MQTFSLEFSVWALWTDNNHRIKGTRNYLNKTVGDFLGIFN